jgi:arsenite/tail-anchored protein-transporting ATPase
MQRDGDACLPLVLVNGEVAARGAYPTRDDLARMAGLRAPASRSKPRFACRCGGCCTPGLGVLLMEALSFGPTRVLFFTGKGGVGKTSLACATAIALADAGRRVLLVSTDPASNLDEVLGVSLSMRSTDVPGVPGLAALNVDPEAAADAYRERVVGPYRAVLRTSDRGAHGGAALGSLHVEIAAFDEFTTLLADATDERGLRPRRVRHRADGPHPSPAEPAGRVDRLHRHEHDRHVLPRSARRVQGKLDTYRQSLSALVNPEITTIVLVSTTGNDGARGSRADERRAGGAGGHPSAPHGQRRLHGSRSPRRVAVALERRGGSALARLPDTLAALPRLDVPLRPWAPLGPDRLRQLFASTTGCRPTWAHRADEPPLVRARLSDLVDARTRRARRGAHDGQGRRRQDDGRRGRSPWNSRAAATPCTSARRIPRHTYRRRSQRTCHA